MSRSDKRLLQKILTRYDNSLDYSCGIQITEKGEDLKHISEKKNQLGFMIIRMGGRRGAKKNFNFFPCVAGRLQCNIRRWLSLELKLYLR